MTSMLTDALKKKNFIDRFFFFKNSKFTFFFSSRNIQLVSPPNLRINEHSDAVGNGAVPSAISTKSPFRVLVIKACQAN